MHKKAVSQGNSQDNSQGNCQDNSHNDRWYNYMWIASAAYLLIGLFNILFAWIGVICFVVPLSIALINGDKSYCNKYCGRGQLLTKIGNSLSRDVKPPAFLSSKLFRYGFLTYFMIMFTIMLHATYKVASGYASLQEAVTVVGFKLPWEWVNTSVVPAGVAQFAFGFYSIMATSTILGFLTMILFKPRTWCVYCPMGTMTQSICKLKEVKSAK